LIDNSQPIFGQSQKISPRRNRGLALSPDGKYLYAGYHHGGNGGGETRKIALNISDDYSRATVRVLNGPMSKALACDDRGRVYISNESEIMIYDSDLNILQQRIPVSVCEGVATAREGKDLVLYASDRELGQLQRFVLEEKGDVVTSAVPAGFDGTGVINLKEAASLRGVEVDPKGNIWVADHDGGRVYRVSKDGKEQAMLDIPGAMDVAFLGDRAYVTRGLDRLVAVVEADSMKLIGNLGIPWDELELSPSGNNRLSSLSGIVSSSVMRAARPPGRRATTARPTATPLRSAAKSIATPTTTTTTPSSALSKSRSRDEVAQRLPEASESQPLWVLPYRP